MRYSVVKEQAKYLCENSNADCLTIIETIVEPFILDKILEADQWRRRYEQLEQRIRSNPKIDNDILDDLRE